MQTLTKWGFAKEKMCVFEWKKMWHWRNIKITEWEDEKMRRNGRCEGYIFHRAEIPENTLYLYSCVKIYIFRNHLCTEAFYIRTNIFPTRASIQKHWYTDVLNSMVTSPDHWLLWFFCRKTQLLTGLRMLFFFGPGWKNFLVLCGRRKER